MKPRTLAVLDAAMDFPLAVAVGLALGLAGAFLASLTPPAPSPAVSTRASAFRCAGWGEAAGDSSFHHETKPAMNETNTTARAADLVDADFLSTLSALESGNQPTAVNRREDAHGIYQIRPAYLEDANRILGTRYTLADCHRPAVAEEVVRAYLSHYGEAWAKRTGKPVTRADLARIHNGGPNGASKPSTICYAVRFTLASGSDSLETDGAWIRLVCDDGEPNEHAIRTLAYLEGGNMEEAARPFRAIMNAARKGEDA